jgi:hypothetical protein
MDNQTDELWVAQTSSSDKGTGVFISGLVHVIDLPKQTTSDIDSSVHGPLKKALVPDITYPQCVRAGAAEAVIAFSWIPNSLASYQTVQASALTCRAVNCVKRCAGYGCLCVAGECK